MKKFKHQQLSSLDSAVLANALLELANQSDEAKAVVDRLTRTEKEAFQATKRAISGLNRSSAFIDWREASRFSNKLDRLVDDIGEIDVTDEQRFDLICRFFETDKATLNRVDDSSGYIGDVYRDRAQEVFDRCAESLVAVQPTLVMDQVELLLAHNDYGVRDKVLNNVVSYLSEPDNRLLIERFSVRCDTAKDKYGARAWQGHILTIASYLKDTALYELIALESVAEYDAVPVITRFEIAKSYFRNNEYDLAKLWMEKINLDERYMSSERNEFLVVLHDSMGDTNSRDCIAREEFNRNPSFAAMNKLLDVIGEDHRSNIIDERVENIFANLEFNSVSLEFLLNVGFEDSAASYTVRCRDTIDGGHYWDLPGWADGFMESGYPVAAICIYRALLDSILQRGYTKSYIYGVRYLIKLDRVASTPLVDGMLDHESYFEKIKADHGRKSSFWKKYESARF